MKIADVQHNQDSGTTVIEVDHWPTSGFPPGAQLVIGQHLWLIVSQQPKLKQVEVTHA